MAIVSSRYRILAPALSALLLLSLLFLAMSGYYLFIAAGISTFVKNGMDNQNAIAFVIRLVLKEILPIYLLTAYACWILVVAWGALPWNLGGIWSHSWTAKQAFSLSLAGLMWIHVCLWWQVPTTLWVIPWVSKLPFWSLFLFLTLLIIYPLWKWLRHQRLTIGRSINSMLGFLTLWSLLAFLPNWFAKPMAVNPASQDKTKILLIGLDGLRPDTAYEQGLSEFSGTHFSNVYTPIPATRLCWNLLWGGDAGYFSVGHALPSLDEFSGAVQSELLGNLKKGGIKARFYIDDGGTIGLAGRSSSFDEVLMPARGWENFVNSNLAVHLPLYASWLTPLRIFPTTTPWTPEGSSIRAALEHGRGADLVMFHSCLIHQPIFLNRKELHEIPRWWTLSPQALRPYVDWRLVPIHKDHDYDTRCDPFRLYAIRTASILKTWVKIWNDLDNDPQYRDATRIFFSDHGERFFHVTPKIRLMGIHGFDLNPWELRIPFIVKSPGDWPSVGPANAVSLLELRDALASWADDGTTVTPRSFGNFPFAPVRYHTLNTEFLRPSDVKYREFSATGIMQAASMFPDGFWAIKYDRPASERGKDVSVARAYGARLIVHKPLQGGGAHRLEYNGLELIADSLVTEDAFQSEKESIETIFLKPRNPGAKRSQPEPPPPTIMK